jgi:hypothetical protein
MARVYNPSYSGGRDQEDRSWFDASLGPILKKTITKKDWLEVLSLIPRKKKVITVIFAYIVTKHVLKLFFSTELLYSFLHN